jgi:hypothetical protein
MTDIRDEVRTALRRIVENMKTMADRKPETPVGAEDFNSLLERAKRAFPNLPTVQEMKSIEGGANVATVFLKVSLLQGAADADHERRVIEDIERANERNTRQWDEFNRSG